MDELNEKCVKLLNAAFIRWQRDQIRAGVPTSQASQTEFSRVLGVPNTSWSSWVLGNRIPTSPGSIRKLAASSYIGNEIYRVLGLPVPVKDKRLRFINDYWDKIPENIQEALLNKFKDSIPEGDESLLDLT